MLDFVPQSHLLFFFINFARLKEWEPESSLFLSLVITNIYYLLNSYATDGYKPSSQSESPLKEDEHENFSPFELITCTNFVAQASLPENSTAKMAVPQPLKTNEKDYYTILGFPT